MKRSVFSHIREFLDTYRQNAYGLKPYLIRDGKTHPVAVICPGGGYRRVCSFVEGQPFAKKLNAMGYHAVVVYYRVKDRARYPAPQEDLARAVREIHKNADRWKLDTRGYSVWGSSAGGHLAACFGTEAMGYAHYGLPKPGAMILIYPVVDMGEKTHPGSREFLLGDHPTQEAVFHTSIQNRITPTYPPTFLWWGDSDETVHPDNSRMLRRALEENGVVCRCIEYPGIGHGVGLARGLSCEDWFEKAVAFWELQR